MNNGRKNLKVYYIDAVMGDDSNDGLSPERALKSYKSRSYCPGDSILFKRNSILSGSLETCEGSEEGYITYGAYGVGEKPVFRGSVSANDADNWIEVQPSVWQYKGKYQSEVCNIIFNNGESCGTKCWDLKDLKYQGEWYYTQAEDVLYLYSSIDPGLFYNSIEVALWGSRRLVNGKHYVILENISFQNGGVHGYQESVADHIIIRNCEFNFIGGAVWDPDKRIRFGNAVEFWDGAQDVLVENCTFNNIYDSGVTHQGRNESGPYERLIFRGNLFVDCGMAAYECRGPAAREVYFEHNTCVNAGGGFSIQGEIPPRRSEIYPEPMGHHVFIWRIRKGTQTGDVRICNNIFFLAPFGMAVYSIIDPEDEKKFIIDRNCYFQEKRKPLIQMNGKIYYQEQFKLYRDETGQDEQSISADPQF